MTNTYNNRLRTALALQQSTGFWTNGFGYDAASTEIFRYGYDLNSRLTNTRRDISSLSHEAHQQG